jgi:hypothetical protein
MFVDMIPQYGKPKPSNYTSDLVTTPEMSLNVHQLLLEMSYKLWRKVTCNPKILEMQHWLCTGNAGRNSPLFRRAEKTHMMSSTKLIF